MRFNELGLSDPLLRALQAVGYEVATPIQSAAIPVVLSGADLVGCAQTGTGKTAAFTLPLLERLTTTPARPAPGHAVGAAPRRPGKPAPRPIRALVLSPTRELAAQIDDSIRRYGRFTPIRSAVIFGGVSQSPQVKALRDGVDVLVATPGRLLDLMTQGHVHLSRVEVLVLDEADQMLDMGFLPDLKRIVQRVPAERQTLMFSATMPAPIRALADEWLTDPQEVATNAVSAPAQRIEQSVHLVDKQRKADLLAHLLKGLPRSRTLVFSRTKHGADKIVKRLAKDGLDAEAIHGNKSQNARTRALARFKGKRPPVLVATDIAARGLDISQVTHVVNYDLPETPETYVHRIGRTGRAGESGIALSFCCGEERELLKQIERLTKARLAVAPVAPGFEPTEAPTPAPPRGGAQRRPAGGGQGRPAAKRNGATQANQRTPRGPGAPADGQPAKRRQKNRPPRRAKSAPA